MAKAQTQTAESLDDFLLEFEGLGVDVIPPLLNFLGLCN
jgi:hypothetical protein